MSRNIAIAIAFALVVCTVCAVGWVLSSTTDVKPFTPKGVPINTPHAEVVRIAQERRAPAPRAQSQIAVEHAEYDFGMMDPDTSRKHTFVFRNTGQEPLHLGNPRSSCKCGNAELILREIPPGGQGGVVVRWNPGADERELAITIKVPTSDPQQKELELVVTGMVRQRLFAEPGRITFTSVVSQSQNTQQTLIYSQVWEDFTIESLESSFPGLTWEIGHADDQSLAAVQALCGHVLRVTAPQDLPVGYFNHWLRFRARPTDETLKPESYEIVVEGNVQRLVGIYGEGIDDTGTIDLGVVQRGTGASRRFLVKVRDGDADLQLRQITTNPSFVTATLTPVRAKGGLYYLDVTIPASAPACEYLLTERGEVHLEYDHPRVKETRLKLRFAVAAPQVAGAPP